MGKEVKEKKSLYPDSELINFADWFSKNYTNLSIGVYFSVNKKYKIIYSSRIKNDSNVKIEQPCRVCDDTMEIQFSKKVISSKFIDLNTVYFLIIWCFYDIQQSGNIISDDERRFISDKKAIKFYLKTGRPTSALMLGLATIILSNPCDLDTERAGRILKQLLK